MLPDIGGGGSEGGIDHAAGRLGARPARNPRGKIRTGIQPLDVGESLDGFLFVPESYSPARPAPLAVTLHGAGGDAHKGIESLLAFAEGAGLILVAPKSRSQTWDVIVGGFGPDVEFIDRALEKVFQTYAVDEQNLAIQGFSDGASYALTLGLTNGDLFSHILALSPGFTAEEERHGKPPIFISHGIGDRILPIDQTSRRIVPRLEQDGYDVTFVEFDGGHEKKPAIVEQAIEWWLDEEVTAPESGESSG
ncbi:MAG: alpha/beta hydrolase-fold protein [Actinomycetota bacterium]|nr:alpha/beta hydrolase-fold protein [Actinomycetota bacterium]